MTSKLLDRLIDISDLTYESGYITSPITNTNNKIIFADDIASGRPCKLVDEFIIKKINPYYSNTHSNATCGIMMKDMIAKTRDIIRHVMNLTDNHKIFFSGNGCTGAINHLVNKIDFMKHSKVFIHTTPFEHHSNFLPWKEKINDLTKMGVFNVKGSGRSVQHQMIHTSDVLELDIKHYISKLNSELENETDKNTRLDIFSLTACSNVTGKRYDLLYSDLWTFIKAKRDTGHHIYMLLDCACIAPYVDLDLSRSDGVYFSGHKFLGGQCTPGILIINSDLIEISHPYEPGGGCVEKADDRCTVYKSDPEMREMGGTPNVVGIIRLGYSMMIKKSIDDIIHNNELILSKYITQKMIDLEDKYNNFKVIGLRERSLEDLPIFPVTIKGLHYNFITVLFNDLFGIQTRGGVSCCGTLGRICKDEMSVDGWCRITFGYLLKVSDIKKILEGLEFIIIKGAEYKNYYHYDENKNLFVAKDT